MLEWLLPRLIFSRVACKRSATLEWHLPPLDVLLGWLTEGLLYHGMVASSSEFYLGSQKAYTSSKFYAHAAHKVLPHTVDRTKTSAAQ